MLFYFNKRRRKVLPRQLELPLRMPELSDEEIRLLWRATLARLKARKQLEILKRSRVEYEQLPN